MTRLESVLMAFSLVCNLEVWKFGDFDFRCFGFNEDLEVEEIRFI
jgi:hypothetical protein